MQNRLFFICPTDRLEPIINSAFNGVNYFYSSLGNSVGFDYHTMQYLEQMIEKNNIREIFFVLAYDNAILLDAIGARKYECIYGMSDFYENINIQNNNAVVLSLIHKNLFTILSSHLSRQIKELKQHSPQILENKIYLEGLILNKTDLVFQKQSCSNIIWLEDFHLN